jgi:hypothetical protein
LGQLAAVRRALGNLSDCAAAIGVLHESTLYATRAVASAIAVLFSDQGLLSEGSVIAAVIGAGLCLLARWRGWQLGQGLAWDYQVRRPSGKKLPRITLLMGHHDGR